MEIILAIDGGGSRTRSWAIDRRGHILGRGESGPCNHLLVGREVALRSLAEATRQALAEPRLREAVACVSAGLAGVDYDGTGAQEAEEMLREIGFAHVIVNGDAVIAHVGALGDQPGVMALAGTGSVILGIGPTGKRVKVGGWGPIYGDEGSAYWIARTALVAAARAYDGRGPATALLEACVRALGLDDFRQTVARIYGEKMEPHEIARLCRVAYEVAERGDPVARSIFLQAGEDLADSVAAAIRRLDLGTFEVLVSYQGAILRLCALLRQHFGQVLRQRFPNVTVVPPRLEPVGGAFLLGCEALGWPVNWDQLDALPANTSGQ